MKKSADRPRRSPSRSNNTFVTKSGKAIKINRSLSDRLKAGREAKARRKAAYLSSLPAEPWKRALYRLSPRRAFRYWFSRQGLIMALKIAGIAFVVGFLLLVGVFAYFRKDLPQIKDISGSNFGGSITYYDRTGQTVLFQDYSDRKRVPVTGDSISLFMKEATVAIEDKNFYKHGAFDTKGIARAAMSDLLGSSGGTQGGSTITQQLVKINEGWTNDHTITRKVKELILAVELEREYSKSDILVGYLNMAPYGSVDYGVQTAAQDYFHVDAKNLTLPQAAMLAAIPKAPGSLSPFNSPNYNPSLATNYFDQQDLIDRKNYILDIMAQQKYITQQQADDAKKVDILAQVQQLQSHYANIKAPYLVAAARDQLRTEFPAAVVDRGGWKVVTTVDLNLQNLAEQVISNNVRNLNRNGANDASFIDEDNATGQVLALVGGTNFSSQQVSFATQALISPGSSIKPYTYTTLINNNTNVGAGSVLYDSQGALPGYACTNKALPPAGNCLWDDTRKYYGAVTLRYALGSSLNVPAVKAFTSVVPGDTSTGHTTSINKVISTADALMGNSDGYKCYPSGTVISEATKADETQCYSAAGIGDGAYLTLADHVSGISSIARLGQYVPQTFILKVTSASGKVLSQYTTPKPKQAVQADSAYIVTDMASDPGASYLGGSCTATTCYGMKFHRYKGWHIAIKTGTTNDQTDGLMMSWNEKFTAGVWVGNYDRSPYTASPENMTDPIMKTFVEAAIDSYGNIPAQNWTEPSDIKTLAAYSSHVPFSTQSKPPATDLFPSWYVGKNGSAETIDKVSGLVATSCTPALAKQSSVTSNAANWNVDIYMGGSTGNVASTQGYDNVHNCNDTQPTATVTAVNGIATSSDTSLTCPLAGCVVMVHVDQGTHPLTDSNYPNYPGTLTLLVNGQVYRSQEVDSSGDYPITYTPSSDTSGAIQLTAQVTDSVLYQGSSDAASVSIASQTSSNGNGAGDGNSNSNSNRSGNN